MMKVLWCLFGMGVILVVGGGLGFVVGVVWCKVRIDGEVGARGR